MNKDPEEYRIDIPSSEEYQIDLPSPEEMDRSVSLILDRGLEKKKTVEWKSLSLSTLLFGVEDCVAIAMMVYLVIMAAFSVLSLKGAPFLPLQFLAAPFLFGGLLYLSLWKDLMNRSAEWKQVCRVDYRAITVLRMILFGGISVVMGMLGNTLLWLVTGRQTDLLWILCFSFSGLFLYGFFSVFLLQRSVRLGTLLPNLIWAVLSTTLFLVHDLTRLVRLLPTSVLLLILAISFAAMALQIRSYFYAPSREGLMLKRE